MCRVTGRGNVARAQARPGAGKLIVANATNCARVIAALVVLIAAQAARATEVEPARDSVATSAPRPSPPRLLFHPSGPGAGRTAVGLGLLADVSAHHLGDVVPALPQLELRVRRGLPRGFAIVADLETVFIQNDASIGLAWSTTLPRLPRWSVQARLAAGAAFGGLDLYQFSTFTLLPLVKPGLAVGFAPDERVRVTLRQEWLVGPWQLVANGGTWTGATFPHALTGSATLLVVETARRGGGSFYLGAGVLVARAAYGFWLLLAHQVDLVAYPRIIVGHVF